LLTYLAVAGRRLCTFFFGGRAGATAGAAGGAAEPATGALDWLETPVSWVPPFFEQLLTPRNSATVNSPANINGKCVLLKPTELSSIFLCVLNWLSSAIFPPTAASGKT